MAEKNLAEAVARILQRDQRYAPEAYEFVCEALAFTMQMLNKPASGPGRHVTGQELLEGIRRYAVQNYGPLARRVLAAWGVQRTEDFGEIVFHLVDEGVLGKAPQDRKEDFAGGYDFEEAFVKPFRPTREEEKGGTGT